MPTPVMSWEQEVIRLLELISNGGGTGGGGGATGGATEANQALAIASLQALDTDNATEAQQIAIQSAINAMQAALLADNATENKQTEQINSLGFTVTDKLSDRFSQIIGSLPGLGTIQQLISDIKAFLAPITWSTPTDGSIGVANGKILDPDPLRRGFQMCNHSTTRQILINIGDDASSTSAIYIIQPGQTLKLEDEAKLIINAIASAGTGNVNYTYRTGS